MTGAIPLLPPTCLHYLGRDNFTFFPIRELKLIVLLGYRLDSRRIEVRFLAGGEIFLVTTSFRPTVRQITKSSGRQAPQALSLGLKKAKLKAASISSRGYECVELCLLSSRVLIVCCLINCKNYFTSVHSTSGYFNLLKYLINLVI